MDTITITQEIKTVETRELKLPKFILSQEFAANDGLTLCQLTSHMFDVLDTQCPGINCSECLLNNITVTKE